MKEGIGSIEIKTRILQNALEIIEKCSDQIKEEQTGDKAFKTSIVAKTWCEIYKTMTPETFNIAQDR